VLPQREDGVAEVEVALPRLDGLEREQRAMAPEVTISTSRPCPRSAAAWPTILPRTGSSTVLPLLVSTPVPSLITILRASLTRSLTPTEYTRSSRL
jgi:hypothetical protein